MAGKRQATSNLNHDNWDQEEEPEERGTFRTATEDELKTRVIKKGRRKVTGGPSAATEGGEDAPAATKSAFSGFSGFGTPNAISGAKSPFSFLANLPAPTGTATATTSPAVKPSFSFIASSTTTAKPSTSIFGSSSISTTKESTSTTDGAKPATSIFGTISSAKKESSEPTSSVFKSSPSSVKPGSASASASAKIPSSPSKSESSQYRESVAELNRAIVKFLQEQVNKSAYCLLSPVFQNYEKHLKELKDEENARIAGTKSTPAAGAALGSPSVAVSSVSSSPKPTATFSFGKPSTPIGGSTSPFAKKPNCTVTSGGTATTTTTPLFSFGTTSVSSASSSTAAKPAAPANSIFSFSSKPAGEAKAAEDAPKPGLFSFRATDSSPKKSEPMFSAKKDDFSFSTKKDEPVATPPKTNGFSFGLKSNNDDKPSSSIFSGFGKPAEGAGGASAGFSFNSGAAPFSFGNIKPPAAVASEEAQDDEDKPPKVEFKQVVEDDAIYSKRCKVFVKKGNDYADRGIGTLYLKPVKDSEKTQMLVRADTNLGNILVNLILSDGIPCQRMGKNNVMMVCMPTPEETKVATMLLRVKTGEEADDLLSQIKKHTK